MPLSDHEQQVLEQMERALQADDPKFASSFRGRRVALASRRKAVLGVFGVIVGLGVLSTAVVVPAISHHTPLLICLALLGFALMVACGYLTVSAWRHPGKRPAGQGSGRTARPEQGDPRRGPQPHDDGGLMHRFEERWSRRHDDEF